MRSRSMRIAAWLLAIAALLVAAVYLANIPLYTGSTIGPRLAWRLEHGRLTVDCKPAPRNPESFYIAPNSEGLRFAPDWHVYGPRNWFFRVPLWLPLSITALASAWLFFLTRRRCKAGACAHCGYDLKGLPGGVAGTTCPECGQEETSKRKAQRSKEEE